MSPLVPFLEHRRGAVLPVPAPWTMSTMSPSPARTPEEEAEGPHCREEEEKQDQEAEEPKAKPKWAVKRHSVSIAIVWVGRRYTLTRGGFNRDRRALRNTCSKCEEGNTRNRSDQDQRRDNS